MADNKKENTHEDKFTWDEEQILIYPPGTEPPETEPPISDDSR